MAGREYESRPCPGPFPKGWQRVIRNPPGPSPWITPPPSGRTPLIEPDQAGPSRVGTGMFPLTPGFPRPVPPPRPRPAPPPGSRLAPPRPGFEFDRPAGRHRRTQPGDADGSRAGCSRHPGHHRADRLRPHADRRRLHRHPGWRAAHPLAIPDRLTPLLASGARLGRRRGPCCRVRRSMRGCWRQRDR
jgi:hypothetical protein